MKQLVALGFLLTLLAGCGTAEQTGTAAQTDWVEEEVSFNADGLTIYGSYRHLRDGEPGPAAVLISESGGTDRNGDNTVLGPVGNMRQLAEQLSEHGVASLRYDKVGTGKTGLGPFAADPGQVGSAVYTAGAKAALSFLAEQPGSDPSRLSAYGLGEGATHAMELAADTAVDAPQLQALGLLQPLPRRYLDLMTNRVRRGLAAEVEAGAQTAADAEAVQAQWDAAVAHARSTGELPEQPLPDSLSPILGPGNLKAVLEADAIDPLAQAKNVPDATAVLLTCSDTDGQAYCSDITGLADALAHTDLTLVELVGVNHVLRDDPTDNVVNQAKAGPLSPQLTAALAEFNAAG